MSENKSMQTNETVRKSVRGFAAMDQNKQREIARKGGRAAHEQGVAHEWSSQEARDAGRKGGQARGKNSTGERSSES
jgi:general stress protein YciG